MNKGFIYSSQDTMFGHRDIIGFGTDDFYVKSISRDLANGLIVKNHYSKKFYTASYVHLGVFKNEILSGVLQFGYAMNPASCGSVVEGTEQDQYLELNRMWLSDELGRNSESMAISYSIKYIKGILPKIKWIQSFADERCGFFGIVYQAANFAYYGEHDSIFWYLGDEVYHNSLMTRNPNLSKSAAYLQQNKDKAKPMKLRQFRYIYFIDQRWRSKCLLKQQKYPKHYENKAA